MQIAECQICDREMAAFAAERGKEIGYENVFDYSLGNPSVPVPEKLREIMSRMVLEMDSVDVFGYSPTLGIPSVKEKLASDLKKRFVFLMKENTFL